MSKTKYVYPSDNELLALKASCGTWPIVANHLKIPPTTLSSYVGKRGLREKANNLNKQTLTPAPLPGSSVSREEMLETENRELKAAIRSARKDDVREEKVLMLLREGLAIKDPRYTPKEFSVGTGKMPHTFVPMWSDAHGGEVVSLEETNGANEYNWNIMLRRFDHFRRGILSFKDLYGKVDALRVASLGDQLSGDIHDELRDTNEMPLHEATVQFGLDGAEFIESFIPYFPRITLDAVVGNHPRPFAKQRSKQKYSNADWTAAHVMAQRLRKTDVEFTIPKAQKHPMMVHDKRLLLQHGDGIRSSMVGVPWGGIVRHEARLRNQYAQLGIPFDHLLYGHYHEINMISNRRIIGNGSIKGVDEYSLDAFGGGQPAAQLLLVFHPKWGLVGAHAIDLDVK